MPKFKSHQNPVEELTALKKVFEKKIMDAGNSSDLPTKITLSKEVVDEYNDSMGTLNTMTKYKANPNDSQIISLKKDLRAQFDTATRMHDRYGAQHDIAVEKEARKIPTGVFKRAEKAILKAEEIKQTKKAEKKNTPVEVEWGEFESYEQNRDRLVREEAAEAVEKKIPTGVFKRAEKAILKAEEIKEAKTLAIDKIDDILAVLLSKTINIGNNLPEARTVAETLYTVLYDARTVYEGELNNGKEITKAGDNFKNLCKDAIATAMPVLERDLGWGEYLKNMMKSLANAVIKGVTLGNVSNFFTQSKSEASKAFDEADQELQSDDDNTPTNP
ncbi:hypothetical protein TUM19329_29080 [Legionella antarctica]|uniref:Uncharacterized protein n=1 Tax=Legionella antarctica TaxID=2708020 RepID=A0A6F8T8V7_9GAMM|nr:hypothetical protein [Legionella antarctica]BCA96547.1 hypothetical protein TUM19329_29080 [Legionella antarctica]